MAKQTILSRNVTRVVTQEIEVTQAECKGAYFRFDSTPLLFLDVQYFDASDTLRSREFWQLSGAVLQTINQRAVNTGNFGGDLVNTCQFVVDSLENNANAKDNLLNNGQLKVYDTLDFTVS